jgi:SulP family sulfate permease
LTSRLVRLLPFLAWRHRITGATLAADAQAGLVGALVVLPQGVAYAALAGMPVEYGLYAAMVPVVVAALWGSSWHQVSGPTNTISLAVFASLAPMAVPGSVDYVRLALTLALMVGAVQLAMGIARLGWLVNFISHTVIVAFTAGAGLLIIAAQLRTFFGVDVPVSADFSHNVAAFLRAAGTADPWTCATGIVTVLAAVLARRVSRVPPMIAGLVVGSAFAWVAGLSGVASIAMVGALPGGVPPLSAPSADLDEWRALLPATVALTTLALAQAVSVARAVAARSGQHLDGNQEFVGQGLSNIAAAFFSGYPSSGSFNRIWVNFQSGAKTPIAAALSALFLLAIVVVVAPLGAHLPFAVMAGLLFVVAWGLVDIAEMRMIVRTNRAEAAVLALTFFATLFTKVELAILVGVIASLVVYLNRTTHPRITPVLPDPASPQRHFAPAPDPARRCPQLEILRIDGSLFFGAVEHVHGEIEGAIAARPGVRNVLFVGSGVNFIDVAGCELLARETAAARDAGITLHAANLKPPVREALERAGTLDAMGRERVFATKGDAIRAIYARLDVETCRNCAIRAFEECASRLPDGSARNDA